MGERKLLITFLDYGLILMPTSRSNVFQASRIPAYSAPPKSSQALARRIRGGEVKLRWVSMKTSRSRNPIAISSWKDLDGASWAQPNRNPFLLKRRIGGQRS